MPSTGHFILHSNVMPNVTAGRYELLTEQTGVPFTVAAEQTHVVVASPRYTLPTDQILSSFPPANAEGAFGDRLPQIVLKRRTLPWERNPAGQVSVSAKPWLALVVVAEGEAELSGATNVADCVTAGTTLLNPEDRDVEQGLYLAVTETVVKKIFPCEQDLELLVHVREVDVNDTELANGDDDGWLAVVLANRLPVFDQANQKPVRYMACLVNLEGQLAALPPPTPPNDTFQFELAQDWTVLASVPQGGGPDQRVLGAELGNLVLPKAAAQGAQRPKSARAMPRAEANPGPLVGAKLDGAAGMAEPPIGKQWSGASAGAQVATAALDPNARQLVRDSMGLGFRLPISLYAQEKVLRFPVLAHWSFSTNEGATFETLMQDLDVGLLGSVEELPPNTPAAGAQPEVVQTGHIGLGHRTRRGDPLRAWYRGPCVPFPTPRDSISTNAPLSLAHAADQLRRVIPDGREDLSLAAAFEIGRLLAVSQLSVVSALLRFRGEQFGAGRVREVLGQILPFPIPEFTDERFDLGRFIALQTVELMAKNPERVFGTRRPIADPGRPLKLTGDLDELIAGGLGLDLGALKKQAASVGLVSALAQTSVPLGMKSGQIPDPKLVIPALRASLEGALAHTLGVAAPQGIVAVVAGPGAPRRGVTRSAARAPRPGPDALDRLIAAAEPGAEETEEVP
jgi:hypothetical protein